MATFWKDPYEKDLSMTHIHIHVKYFRNFHISQIRQVVYLRTFQIIPLYIYIISLQCAIGSSILAMTTILTIPIIHFLTYSIKNYTSYTWTNTLIFNTITRICCIYTTFFSIDFNNPVNQTKYWTNMLYTLHLNNCHYRRFQRQNIGEIKLSIVYTVRDTFIL